MYFWCNFSRNTRDPRLRGSPRQEAGPAPSHAPAPAPVAEAELGYGALCRYFQSQLRPHCNDFTSRNLATHMVQVITSAN